MILTLPFLGKRHYLHGTTLLDALLVYAENPFKFLFKIEKPIFSNTIEVVETSSAHSAVLYLDGKTLFVKEKSLTIPVERESFDEQVLVSHLEKREGRFLLPLGDMSPVRGLVMAFKHVLLKYYPLPQCPGHWVFICLDAVHLPLNNTCSCLALEKVYCRDKMAFCSISFDETYTATATCYFAWANF